MSAPKEILDLVERFKRNREEYESGKYNETQLRREFLDPFFKALGWDIANEKGRAEAYKEVIHEDAIKIGAATKAPDYCFRVGGTRKFFLEAKKPSINIKDDLSPAFQLRRYAWSAKLPLSILSDFEEFAVYDCRVKPYKNDKSNTARLMYFTFDQYIDKWDGIASIFSQEAVLSGSFDKFADASKGKKGTTTVDEAFLEEIEKWRKELAKNIALKNSKLTVQDLNFSVQKIIDRIIFLRICEDRGIEQYGKLLALTNGAKVYDRLTQVFQRADEKFNSGLFHFQKEKDRPEQPDELTLNLKIDDKIFKEMIGGLYYPESPYEFSALPADILGQVYEQFLGKVIRLTDGHQAKVEDKPEVKKAGGVFYTPTYIVEYIVKNTVGKLCEGKNPKQVVKLRILDPACGSGSFLIGAYQYLLDWHRDWYVNDNPQNHQKELYQGPGNDWRLTTDTRKKILLNNIYGVDIDPQAVEVTKLSLLLKVLEGESDQTLKKQLEIFHQRALPDLGSNIKCGNSLIGPEYFSSQLLSDMDEVRRINPFDWNKEFEEIIKSEGFDGVIGNPPYGAFFGETEKKFITENFKTYKYKYDSYIYFIEKGIQLSKPKGYLGYITPELWLKLESGEPLRRFIHENSKLETLRICGENVFADAVINTIVLIAQIGLRASDIRIETNDGNWEVQLTDWEKTKELAIDYRIRPGMTEAINKIREKSKPLQVFGETVQGITPYDKYRGQSKELIKSRAFHFDHKKDKSCGKWLAGEDIGRYELKWSGEWLRYGPWLAAPRDPKFFEGLRILFREVPGKGKRIQAAFAEETLYHGHSITPFKPNSEGSKILYFILGLVNSKLLSWFGRLTLSNFGKEIFPKLNPQDINSLPIYVEDKSGAGFKKVSDNVKKIVELNKNKKIQKNESDIGLIKRQIDALDSEIDKTIYELYGLSEAEIKIIETDMK